MTVFNFPLTFSSRSLLSSCSRTCPIPFFKFRPFSSLSADGTRNVGDNEDVGDEEAEEEEEDPYESIYEEVGPPGRNGDDDADQFYGSESDFDEIPDDDEKVHEM